MNTPRASVVTFARSVIAAELAADGSDPASVADRAVSKLYDGLGKLVGSAGFDALLSRSLVLAAPSCPGLAAVRVVAGGRIDGFRATMAEQDVATVTIAAEALVAHFVELLLVLIGEDLGMRLVGVPWAQGPQGPAVRKGKR